MRDRSLIGALALVATLGAALGAALCAGMVAARAFDDTRYPDFKGQWRPVGGPMRFDTNKPWGQGQQAPLVGEQLVQAGVQRPVGERAEQPEDTGDLLAQLIAVHRRPVQHPEHGELKHCGPVAPHAAPSVCSIPILCIHAMRRNDTSYR